MIRKFPGKLFLMGEYFVTKTDGEAIVIAVDRFITTKTNKSEVFHLFSDYGEISESQTTPSSMKVALEAVRITYEYLDYLDTKSVPLRIEVQSTLIEDGIKVGLGSSAVIINAIIQSVLESHQINLSKFKIFKLSVLCQRRLGDLSSGGDLAASIFTGMIYYRKYNEEFLEQQVDSFKLLDVEWPSLVIRELDFPSDLELMIAWTGEPNKTDNYLRVFNNRIRTDPNTYQKFTKSASLYVNMFVDGNYEEAFFNYRKLMLELELWTTLKIETSKLNLAILISQENHAYAKISGSGGGDCMIALLPKQYQKYKQTIINKWTKNQIKYLDIGVWMNDTITKKR